MLVVRPFTKMYDVLLKVKPIGIWDYERYTYYLDPVIMSRRYYL